MFDHAVGQRWSGIICGLGVIGGLSDPDGDRSVRWRQRSRWRMRKLQISPDLA
jgi:hypothetical protein